jgi:hypothetical protein
MNQKNLLHKMWLKLAKNDQKLIFEKVIFDYIRCKNVFHDLKNVKNSPKKFENQSILTNFDQFWPILAVFYEFKSRFEKSW